MTRNKYTKAQICNALLAVSKPKSWRTPQAVIGKAERDAIDYIVDPARQACQFTPERVIQNANRLVEGKCCIWGGNQY